MQVGYQVAGEENIDVIRKFGMGGYSMNQAGLAAAIASLNDEAIINYSKQKIIEGCSIVLDALKANGLNALPSTTNFVFVNLGSGNAEVFRQKMAEQDVLILGIYQDYSNWSHVSLGRIEDVHKYVNAMPIALEAMYKAVG